jgi:hypothetical protein
MQSILSDGSVAYFYPAAPMNAPAPQIPGDIQSASISSLQTPSRQAFLYSPNIIQSVNPAGSQETAIGVVYSGSGIQYFYGSSAKIKLPALISGQNWSYTAGSISSHPLNPGAALLQISSESNLSFKRTVHVVCPVLHFINITGCYSCTFGFSITISVKSTCLDGNVMINATGFVLNTVSIYIDTSTKELTISAIVALENVVGSLCTVGTHRDVCIDIEGTLLPWRPINNNTNLGNTSAVIADKRGFSLWFSAGQKWWVYFIIAIVLTTILVACLAIAFILVKVAIMKGLLKRPRMFYRKLKK